MPQSVTHRHSSLYPFPRCDAARRGLPSLFKTKTLITIDEFSSHYIAIFFLLSLFLFRCSEKLLRETMPMYTDKMKRARVKLVNVFYPQLHDVKFTK